MIQLAGMDPRATLPEQLMDEAQDDGQETPRGNERTGGVMQLKTTQRETEVELPTPRAKIEARELERIYGRAERTVPDDSGALDASEYLESFRSIVRRLEVLAEEERALDELDILAQAEEANAMDPVG